MKSNIENFTDSERINQTQKIKECCNPPPVLQLVKFFAAPKAAVPITSKLSEQAFIALLELVLLISLFPETKFYFADIAVLRLI